jgi:hypothetical protein
MNARITGSGIPFGSLLSISSETIALTETTSSRIISDSTLARVQARHYQCVLELLAHWHPACPDSLKAVLLFSRRMMPRRHMSFHEPAQNHAHCHYTHSAPGHQDAVRFQDAYCQPTTQAQHNHSAHCAPEPQLTFHRWPKALRFHLVQEREHPGAQNHKTPLRRASRHWPIQNYYRHVRYCQHQHGDGCRPQHFGLSDCSHGRNRPTPHTWRLPPVSSIEHRCPPLRRYHGQHGWAG